MNDRLRQEHPQDNDGEWFDEIVCQNHLPLFLYILKQVHNSADAKDLLQDVWERAWNHRDELKEAQIPLAWLTKILKDANVDLIRRNIRRSNRIVEQEPQELEDLPDKDKHFEWRLRVEMEEALETLPEKHREVVELHFYEGLNTPEIALRLGIPVNTVYSRLRNGILIMRKYFEGK